MVLIRINPTKVLVFGDLEKAKSLMGPAKSQMQILLNQLSFQNLSQGVRRLWLNQDTHVECIKCYNHQECRIWVRPETIKEETIDNFILIITDRTGEEAFAWDLIENKQIEEFIEPDGNVPLGKKTFEEIKQDLIRLKYVSVKDIATDSYKPTQLKITDSFYESWWKCNGTPNCSNPDWLEKDLTEFNNSQTTWPDYYKIDRSKMSPDDCICEPERHLTKLNYPVLYDGVTTGGHDPNYAFGAITKPLLSKEDSASYMLNSSFPRLEFMVPYISYFNHYRQEQEYWDKAGYIIKKEGYYTGENTPESEKNPCNLPDLTEEDYEVSFRSFFWYHSVFGWEAHMNKDDETWYFATKTNLDIMADFLFDTWDDDCYYEYLTDVSASQEPGCFCLTWPFTDFGIASNQKGAVVFDFCVVAWGYSSTTMPMDSRYLGAVSGKRKQIFKIYISEYEQLQVEEKSLARGCFERFNDIRKEQNLTVLSFNSCLEKAAKRHAVDQAINVAPNEWGHYGSDLSSTMSRIEDSGYITWIKPGQQGVFGEVISGQIGEFEDPVTAAIDDWRTSPEHWAAILFDEFTEVGIATASHDDVTVFVAVFGNLPDKWPGFSPMDTTELEAFMNENFTWSGEENKRRVPKLYLA